MKFLYLSFVICHLSFIQTPLYAERIGFLILAPDRGYQGNEEVREIFEEYRKDFPLSTLAIVPYHNPKPFILQSVEELIEKKASRIISLPLFLSHHDIYFKKAKEILTHLPYPMTLHPITFAEPMSESHLISEILVDRIRELSQDPEQEVLFLIGGGASREENEKEIENDLKKIFEWSEGRFPIKEKKIFVLQNYYAEQEKLLLDSMKRGSRLENQTYSNDAPPDEKEKKGSPLFDATEVIEWNPPLDPKEKIVNELDRIRKRGDQSILIPFFLGIKMSPMMSEWNTFTHELNNSAIRIPNSTLLIGKELLPHPNILLWLKKKSLEAQPIEKDEIGIILASHGGDIHWNEEMIKACLPLEKEYKVEHAFGMIEPEIIQAKVNILEERGAKAILLLRIFALERSFEEEAQYILGLRKELPTGGGHNHPLTITHPLSRIHSSSLFYTTGGIEDDPLYAEVLLERATAISRDPPRETVILVSHGMEDEMDNLHWIKTQESLAYFMRKKGGDPFKEILSFTLREDWQELRENSVAELRKRVEEVNERGGEVLIVANRINGPGPTELYLQGLSFRFNGEGFIPHPNFLKIIRRQIEGGINMIVKK